MPKHMQCVHHCVTTVRMQIGGTSYLETAPSESPWLLLRRTRGQSCTDAEGYGPFLIVPQKMRSPRAGTSRCIGHTSCLGLCDRWSILVLWEASFLWNLSSSPAPIPLRRDLIRSSYFTPFSSVDKHLNERGLIFLGFTWDLVQFLSFSRGRKRDKEKAFLECQSWTVLAQSKAPETSFLGVRVPGPTLTVSQPSLTEQYMN